MRQNKKSETPVQNGSQLIKSMRRVSYFELLDATNNLVKVISLEQELLVYKAMPLHDMEVAVKILNMQLQEAFQSFDAQCEILRSFRHRNLVHIISSCYNLDFKKL